MDRCGHNQDFICLERRKKTLENKAKKTEENPRIVASMDYNPLLSKKYWRNTTKPELKGIFKEPPMAALRRGSHLI
jgi:hypothetical protein